MLLGTSEDGIATLYLTLRSVYVGRLEGVVSAGPSKRVCSLPLMRISRRQHRTRRWQVAGVVAVTHQLTVERIWRRRSLRRPVHRNVGAHDPPARHNGEPMLPGVWVC